MKRRGKNDWWPAPKPPPPPPDCDVCEDTGRVRYFPVFDKINKRESTFCVERPCPHCKGGTASIDAESGERVYDCFEETEEIDPTQSIVKVRQPCACLGQDKACPKCDGLGTYLERKRFGDSLMPQPEPMPLPSAKLFEQAGDIVLPWNGGEVKIGVDPGMQKDTAVLVSGNGKSVRLINAGEPEVCSRCGGTGHDGSDHDL